MHAFRYSAPDDADAALRALASARARPLGGGTDLLPRVQEGRTDAAALVDLRRVAAWRGVTRTGDGALRIGAATTLAAIARDPLVLRLAPALAQAAAAVGTPQLRAMGTLGGNLCQAPRCWYWRQGIGCRRSDRALPCHAIGGAGEHHAVLGAPSCPVAHPSDPAVALTALDATVETARLAPAGDAAAGEAGPPTRSLGIVELLAPSAPYADTALAEGEVVTHVTVPASRLGGRQRYEKVTQRAAWDFALVSLAVAEPATGGDGPAPQLVLGGVAPTPWPVGALIAERARSGEDPARLAEEVLTAAHPLSRNAYKVTIARHLLIDAFVRLAPAS